MKKNRIKSQIIVSETYDMTIYIRYDRDNQIIAINFMCGIDDIEESELCESDEFLTEFFHACFDSIVTPQKSDVDTVIEVCNLYTKVMVREMDFKKKTFINVIN